MQMSLANTFYPAVAKGCREKQYVVLTPPTDQTEFVPVKLC